MTRKIECAFEALKDKIAEVQGLERKLTEVVEHDSSLTPQEVGDWIAVFRGRCRVMLAFELKAVYARYPATTVAAYKKHGSPYDIVLDFVAKDGH